ncbi:CinA family protein [bacterium SCSIO 12696]|nr:CinA family protein [bacterium SCSIO 12696]
MPEFGYNLAKQLGDALLRRGWRVTCAESCTGGGVSSAITAVAGSSQWFDGGVVTYSNRVKSGLLGVPDTMLETNGAVSEATVCAMAEGVLELMNTDVAVAVSGIAGPDGGTQGKPVGTVWFAWCSKNSRHAECRHFIGDRQRVRQQAVEVALSVLLEMVTSSS